MIDCLPVWLSSASAAGVGAFCGALGAYFLACRKESERRKSEYLCLLLVAYSHLRELHSILTNLPKQAVKEIDGVLTVELDLPLPNFPLSNEQLQTLMEVSPDKQMPSTLITLQHFLKTNSLRVTKSGSVTFPLPFVTKQADQLRFMLLSVRTQYEQAANDVFPLGE